MAPLAAAKPTWVGSCQPHPACVSLGKSLPLSGLRIFPGLFPDTSTPRHLVGRLRGLGWAMALGEGWELWFLVFANFRGVNAPPPAWPFGGCHVASVNAGAGRDGTFGFQEPALRSMSLGPTRHAQGHPRSAALKSSLYKLKVGSFFCATGKGGHPGAQHVGSFRPPPPQKGQMAELGFSLTWYKKKGHVGTECVCGEPQWDMKTCRSLS